MIDNNACRLITTKHSNSLLYNSNYIKMQWNDETTIVNVIPHILKNSHHEISALVM